MPKPKHQYDFNKLTKRLRRNTAEAIVDFNMIEDGDRVMVCLSGGKDSYTMLDMLLSLQKESTGQLLAQSSEPRPETTKLSRAHSSWIFKICWCWVRCNRTRYLLRSEACNSRRLYYLRPLFKTASWNLVRLCAGAWLQLNCFRTSPRRYHWNPVF